MLGLTWGLGLFWLSCTGVTWTDKTCGEGQVFHSISGSIARIHPQGDFYPCRVAWCFFLKQSSWAAPNPSLTVLQQVSEVVGTQVRL